MRDKGVSWKYVDAWMCKDVIIRNGGTLRKGKRNRDSIKKERASFLYISISRIVKYNLLVYVKCSYTVESRSWFGNKRSRIVIWIEKFSSWLSSILFSILYEATTSSSFCSLLLLDDSKEYYHCLLPASCSSFMVMSYSLTASLTSSCFLPASWSFSSLRFLSEYAHLINVGGGAILLDIYWDLWIPPGSLLLLFFWDWGIMVILLGKWKYHYGKNWNLIGGLMSWGDFSKINSVRKCLSIEKNLVGIGLGVDIDELELIYKLVGIESWAVERMLHDNVWKKEGGKGWVVSPRLEKTGCIINNKRVRLIDIQEEAISEKVVRLAKRVVNGHDLVIESRVMEVRVRIEIYVDLLSWVRIKISIYLSFSSIIIARSIVIYTYNNKGLYKYAVKKDSRTDVNSVAEVQKGNKSKGEGSSEEEVGGWVKVKNLQKFVDDWSVAEGYYIYGWKSKVGKELGYHVLEGLYTKGKGIRIDYILGEKYIGNQGLIVMLEVNRKRTQSEKEEQVIYINNRRRKQKSNRLTKLIYISNRVGSYKKGMRIIRASRDQDKYDKCSSIVRKEKVKRVQKKKSRKYVLGDIGSMYEIIGIGILLVKKCLINQGTLVTLVESKIMMMGVKVQYNRKQDVHLYYTNRRQEMKERIKSSHKRSRIGYRSTRHRERMEIDIVGNNSIAEGYNKDERSQNLGNNEIRERLRKINYENLVGIKISIRIEVYLRKGMYHWRNRKGRRRNSRNVHAYIMLLCVLSTQSWCLAWKVEHWIKENIRYKRSRKRNVLYLIIQKYHKEINKNWGWKGGIINKNDIKRKVGKGPKNIIREVNGKYDSMKWILILMEGFEYDKDKGGIDMKSKDSHAECRCKLSKGNRIIKVGKGSNIKINRQLIESSKVRDWNIWLKRIRRTRKWNKIIIRNILWNKCRLIKQAWRRNDIEVEYISSHMYLMILIKENKILKNGRSSIYRCWVKDPMHSGRMKERNLGCYGSSSRYLRIRIKENNIPKKGRLTIYRSLVKDPIHSGRIKERNLGCYGCRHKYRGGEYGKGRKDVMKITKMNGNSYRKFISKRIICCGRIKETILHRFRNENNAWIWNHARGIIVDIIGNNVASERYCMGADRIILQMPRWNKYMKPFEIWMKGCKGRNRITVYDGSYEWKSRSNCKRIERRKGRIITEDGLNCCLGYCDWKILAYCMSEPYRKNRGTIGSVLNDLKKRMIFEKNHLRQIIKVDQEVIQKEYKVDGIRKEENWLCKVRNEISFQFRKHDVYRFQVKSFDKIYNLKLGVWGVCRGYISPLIKSRDIKALNPYKWIGINTLGSYNEKIGNG